ncbi:MAG: hypothetical protein WCH43_17260, partial [Verrucomicrobiota bacterium]
MCNPSENPPNQDRRGFIKTGGAAVAAFLAQAALPAAAHLVPTPASTNPVNPATAKLMPTRNLGKT